MKSLEKSGRSWRSISLELGISANAQRGRSNIMQHKILSNPAYLEGKVAYLENKNECPYQPGPEKGMWLAGVAEMREELRVLRESLQLQARAR